MITYFHSGCLGDIIYSLPSVQALGAGHYYWDDRPWTAPLKPKVYYLLPLLRTQPCITGVSRRNGEFIDYDFSTFRFGGLCYGEPIIKRQARWVRANIDTAKPWLQTQPQYKSEIVVSRGPRWNGFAFPWQQLVSTFGKQMLFVGLRSEYESFRQQFGHIDYCATVDLLQVAEIIAGCKLFIGSQSAPLAIAEGLHKRTIVEVCPFAPDCFNFRPENIHVIDGSLSFMFDGQHFVSYKQNNLDKDQFELIERTKSTYHKYLLDL